MKEIYLKKGLKEQEANTLVNILEKNPEYWVDVMMVEELGILHSDEDPLKNAIVTFFAFVFFGFMPVLPYIGVYLAGKKNDTYIFFISMGMTAFCLIILGLVKAKFTH